MILLQDKTMLLAGSTSFLGRGIIERLSGKFNILETSKRKVDSDSYFSADLTIEENAIDMMKWALYKFDRINYFICCVGGNRIYPNIDDSFNMNSSDVVKLFEKNVLAAINCCKHLVPHMIENGYGRICLIGSDMVGKPQHNGYSTSYIIAKAALHEYTIHLSNQLKDYDICVNCVSPCGINGSSNNRRDTDVELDEVVDCIDHAFESNITGKVFRVVR